MVNLRTKVILATGVCLVAAGCATQMSRESGSADRVYETNVTNNMNLASGEPEITVDPTNPKNLAIVEFALGSDLRPAWKFNPVAGARTPEDADESMRHNARVMISNDGGNTWHARQSPTNSPNHSPGGGDPMIAAGPDGALYVASEPFPRSLGQRGDTGVYTFLIAVSHDWGKTFEPAKEVGTPVNRPFITVDQSTGKVYSASSGSINFKTGQFNKPGPDSVSDRWLVAWGPGLKTRSEPRRMGGDGFTGAGGTHAAAHGAIASTIVIGGPVMGAGRMSADGTPPASLKPLLKNGVTTCTPQAPCLFFQYSRDDGLTWTREHVPVPGGFQTGLFTYLAADQGRAGRFAIGMLAKGGQVFQTVVTDDWGKTWSAPAAAVDVPPISQAATPGESPIAAMQRGAIIKPWMAYGPSGVLGIIWRQTRLDAGGPPMPPQSPVIVWGPGFDVYAGISCDGGKSWQAPLRVNAKTSPRGPSAQDDLSYIALDKRYAHLIWGDRRDIDRIKNEPMGAGGIQAYYGRVPFTVASKGARCGRG